MKLARHEKIIELIKEYDIDTQEELAARLNEAGFKVTQATVSRDIRALKMTKVAGKDGKSRYAILQDTQPGLGDQYTRVLNDAVVSIEVGQNLVVIKTVTGMAMGVATALDALKWPEILGCIAGDDTIMCACKSSELAEGVMEKLVVIKTVTGMAMGVATALDALKWPEILGCIAGDDTIMCACKSSELAEGVMEKLGSILNRR